MNKKIKVFLIALLLIAFGGFYVWNYINKPMTDYSEMKAAYNFTFSELIKKMETDTSNLKSKIITVEGNIKTIIKDSATISLEIGYDSIASSITCQIDSRHLSDFDKVKEGNTLNIKGLVSDISVDAESAFGNTIQMTYCVLHKK